MELLSNAIFWTAPSGQPPHLLAQTVKLLLYYRHSGRFQWGRFLETGGMPSSRLEPR